MDTTELKHTITWYLNDLNEADVNSGFYDLYFAEDCSWVTARNEDTGKEQRFNITITAIEEK